MRFAFTGIKGQYDSLLQGLIALAEEEPWTCETENDILKAYINKTFEKCFQQKDILVSQDENYACFDSGLLSRKLEKIYGLFVKNDRDTPYWKLKRFCPESETEILKNFPTKPKKTDYFSNPEDYYFNPKAEITPNLIHFFDEEENVFDRLPEDIKKLPPEDIIALIKGKIGILKDRIERNPRIVIPLYYKDKITFACPISIMNHDLALIIGKYEGDAYRVNTIFPLSITYKKARMLMRPEANWLALFKEKDATEL